MLCSHTNIMLAGNDTILNQQLRERNVKTSYDLSMHSKHKLAVSIGLVKHCMVEKIALREMTLNCCYKK